MMKCGRHFKKIRYLVRVDNYTFDNYQAAILSAFTLLFKTENQERFEYGY